MRTRRILRSASDSRALAWLAAGLLGIGAGGTAAAQQAIDTELARAFLAEADALGRAARPLWGTGLDGPMLFVDGRTREVVANAPDTLGVLLEEGGVWAGVLPPDVGVANTALAWGGRRWTMLVWPLPYGRLSRGRLLVHEMFHRVQPELGLPGADATNAHLDTEEGRLLLRLEWRALQLALADTGAARRRALSDAVWFRRQRHERFPAGTAEERALELNEGLAEYTGMRVAVPANARAGWAAVQIENYDARASDGAVGRSFAYATGPALGLLLDAADDTWRTRVEDGTDLSRLLAEAYGITPDSERGLAERWGPYDGERLAVEESGRSRAIAAREERMRARFVEGPTLTLPATEEVRYTFNPGEVVPYGEGGAVYLTTEVRDAWGLLKVTMGGALLIREGGRIARIIVPAPGTDQAAAPRGDGWTLELQDGWELVPGARAGDFVVLQRSGSTLE